MRARRPDSFATVVRIMFVAVLLAVAACGPERRPPITIRGRIGTMATAKGPGDSASITRVLVYRDFGIADLAGVDADGRFAVSVDRDDICGLVFLDADDAVVGWLSLAAGIDALPISLVDDGVAEVDLAAIDFTGVEGLPEHNPIDPGGEMELDATERVSFRLQSALFSAILRNLDMDADGTIDVLSDRPYFIKMGVQFLGGPLVTADPGAAAPTPTLQLFMLGVTDFHDTVGSPTAILHVPDAGDVPCSFTGTVWPAHGSDPTEYPAYWWTMPAGLTTLPSGSYSVTYGAGPRRIAFDITSPLNDDTFIVASNLWLEMDGDRVHQVHWRWRMLNGADLDASRLVRGAVVQVGFTDGHPQIFGNPVEGETAYTLDLDANASAHLSFVTISTQDLFGSGHSTQYGDRP